MESTVKVNLQNVQLKTLLEFNCTSIRELITKLLKSFENPPLLPDVVAALPNLVAGQCSPSSFIFFSLFFFFFFSFLGLIDVRCMVGASFAEGAQSTTTLITNLLSEVAAITDPSSPHYGDPSVPIKYSKQLNEATNTLIREIRKT